MNFVYMNPEINFLHFSCMYSTSCIIFFPLLTLRTDEKWYNMLLIMTISYSSQNTIIIWKVYFLAEPACHHEWWADLYSCRLSPCVWFKTLCTFCDILFHLQKNIYALSCMHTCGMWWLWILDQVCRFETHSSYKNLDLLNNIMIFLYLLHNLLFIEC
jgi:hypothetical protein